MSADAENGQDEKTLARSGRPFPISLACAPDGEKAAMSTEAGGIAILDFKTGQSRPFYQSAQGSETYGDLSWRTDGSELIGFGVTPFDFDFNLLLLSYPQGTRTQVTHEIDSYRNPSITADGKTIVARQIALNAQFESFNLPLLAENPEVNSFPWAQFLGWRDEDRIVGSTVEGGIKTKQIEAGQEGSIQIANGMHFLQPPTAAERTQWSPRARKVLLGRSRYGI